MKVIWSDDALDDIARLIEFLLPLSAKTAERTAAFLLDGPDKLRVTPRLGKRVSRPGPEEIRCLIIQDYELPYELRSGEIIVLRIWHTREDR